jgi:hypothetical protein
MLPELISLSLISFAVRLIATWLDKCIDPDTTDFLRFHLYSLPRWILA